MEKPKLCLICNEPFHYLRRDDQDRGVCYAEACKLKYMKQNVRVTKEEVTFIKKLVLE